MKKQILIGIIRIIASAILMRMLIFKLDMTEASVYFFTTLGIEPYGRIGFAIAELIAAVLILIPKTTWIGAFIATVIMFTVIESHLFIFGIVIHQDNGLSFGLAIITLFCSLVLIFQNPANL